MSPWCPPKPWAAPSPTSFFPGPSGHWPRLTFLCPSSPSKQRHNKLWRQQADDSCFQQPGDDPAGPGDFQPETLDSTREAQPPCLDAAGPPPGFPGSGALGGPALPCCFRRLSDPLLRAPDDETGSPVHLEDLERDALLEEATQLAEASQPARPPPESPRLCEREVTKKPEPGSPQAQGGSSPQAEEMEREEALGAGRWGRPAAQLDNLLNRENLNNNNSKRSCPDDFEVGVGVRGWHTRLPLWFRPGGSPPPFHSCLWQPLGGFLRGSAGPWGW